LRNDRNGALFVPPMVNVAFHPRNALPSDFY
jgi:hypothetical protein